MTTNKESHNRLTNAEQRLDKKLKNIRERNKRAQEQDLPEPCGLLSENWDEVSIERARKEESEGES